MYQESLTTTVSAIIDRSLQPRDGQENHSCLHLRRSLFYGATLPVDTVFLIACRSQVRLPSHVFFSSPSSSGRTRTRSVSPSTSVRQAGRGRFRVDFALDSRTAAVLPVPVAILPPLHFVVLVAVHPFALAGDSSDRARAVSAASPHQCHHGPFELPPDLPPRSAAAKGREGGRRAE